LGRDVACESGPEYRVLNWLERSPEVRWYQEQPVAVPYSFGGRNRVYYPDVAVWDWQGRVVVVEIKPLFTMYRQDTIVKATAAWNYFAARGMGYLLVDASGRTIADLTFKSYDKIAAEGIESQFARGPVPFRKVRERLSRLSDRFDFPAFVSMVVNRDWAVWLCGQRRWRSRWHNILSDGLSRLAITSKKYTTTMSDYSTYLSCTEKSSFSEVYHAQDPETYIFRHEIELRLIDEYGEEFEGDPVIGKAHVAVLNLEGADKAGVARFDVLDTEAWLAHYMALFSDYAGEFSKPVMKLLGEDVVFSNNILILDRLEILPDYRGEELGLRFIKAAVRRYGIGCRLVAIKPYPLQHESTDRERDEWREQMALNALSKDQHASTAKLKRYYERAKFKAVRGTELMIRDLEAKETESDD
jgi:hypothetical protein